LGGLASYQEEFAASDPHGFVGRKHINVIALGRHAVHYFRDRNFREAGKYFRQNALMIGIEVRNEDISHSCIHAKVGQQFLECFKPAGRSADAGDWK